MVLRGPLPIMRIPHSTHTDGPGKAAVMPADPGEGPHPGSRGAGIQEPWAGASTGVSTRRKGQGRVSRFGIVQSESSMWVLVHKDSPWHLEPGPGCLEQGTSGPE